MWGKSRFIKKFRLKLNTGLNLSSQSYKLGLRSPTEFVVDFLHKCRNQITNSVNFSRAVELFDVISQTLNGVKN